MCQATKGPHLASLIPSDPCSFGGKLRHSTATNGPDHSPALTCYLWPASATDRLPSALSRAWTWPTLTFLPYTFSLPSSFQLYTPQTVGCPGILEQRTPGLNKHSQKAKKIPGGAMEVTGRALWTPPSASCQQSNYIHVSDRFNC